ncbi:MAG: hypothetical protein IPI12_14145 [Ignavibacteriales bacterium]|nr:hypothetical protein [Ignavibacteriales bacterium]
MLYHQLALYKASYFTTASLTIEEKTQLLLSALADEAFAIHFLEDFTAAGTQPEFGVTLHRKRLSRLLQRTRDTDNNMGREYRLSLLVMHGLETKT